MSELLSAIGGGAVGVAVGEAGATVLTPALEAPRQEAWKQSKARILDLHSLATLVAQALNAVDDVLDDAERNGYDRDALASAIQLALRAPGPPEAEALYLRSVGKYPGGITLEQLHHAYAKAGLEGQWWDALTAAAREALLSPAELALGAVRGTLNDQGLLVVKLDTTDSNVKQYVPAALNIIDEAAAAGINPERLRALIGSIGLPMAVELAARATYRGILTKGAYYQAVLEGDTRPEWADAIYDVAREILTSHNYAELQLRGYLTETQRREGTRKHGMSDADSDLLYDVLGRSINVHQIITGIERGGAYQGDTSQIPPAFLAALQRGNLRPEYYSLAYANRFTLPTAFVVRALLKDGAITAEQGRTLLLQNGWPDEWATLVANHYGAGGTTGTKRLTVAQIHAAWKTVQLTTAEALTRVEADGYSPADAQLIVNGWGPQPAAPSVIAPPAAG